MGDHTCDHGEGEDFLKRFYQVSKQLKLSFDGAERQYLIDTVMHLNWDDRVQIEGKDALGMAEFSTLNDIVAETTSAGFYVVDDARREWLKGQKQTYWLALSKKGLINTMEFLLEPAENMFPKIQRAIECAGKYSQIQPLRVPEYHRMLMHYTNIADGVFLLDGALDDLHASLLEGNLRIAERQRDAFMLLVSSVQHKYDVPVASTQDICTVLMAAKHTAIDEIIEKASKVVENKEDPKQYCAQALALRDFKFQPSKLHVSIPDKEHKEYSSNVEERVFEVTRAYEQIKSS